MPITEALPAEESWQRAREVFDSRCIVCHGCCDAPCQLKLESYAARARSRFTKLRG